MSPLLLIGSRLKKCVFQDFGVFNCWLNPAANCLDNENEVPLKVIASFSASRFALPSIPLMVIHSLMISVFWSKVSTKSLNLFCVRRYGLAVQGELGALLQKSCHAGVVGTNRWCPENDGTQDHFSCLAVGWKSSFAYLVLLLYQSQFIFLMLKLGTIRLTVTSFYKLLRIGRWSELR